MSDEKTEVDDGSKAEKSREVVEEKKSKAKIESSSKKGKPDDNEESSGSADETSENNESKAKSKKVSKKSKDIETEELDTTEKKRIPLLDQPAIVEGTRVRRTVLRTEVNEDVKPGSVVIPAGKGKPLGSIPVVKQRLKRLRITTIKDLHRLLFGRIGKIALLSNNIQKFRGFPFLEDSDNYNRKLTALNKLHMNELKEIIFSFDLDMKLKKKEECAKEILNFLIFPKTFDKTHNPSFSHPKRKATKRNYFNADIEEEENKKRKKTKPTTEVRKEEKGSENKNSSVSARSLKTNEKNSKNNDISKKNEDQDNSNELKKPAKKRKRNQIIEEEENKKTKLGEETENGEKKRVESEENDDEEGSANNDEQSSPQKTSSSSDKLTDEELEIFLKKVLANLNLENTTMKTVFNLINSEYPTYDFSKRKTFIKGVVKSLIQ